MVEQREPADDYPITIHEIETSSGTWCFADGEEIDPLVLEVTPEMIEAGVSELALYDQMEDDGREAVVRIFVAMSKAKDV